MTQRHDGEGDHHKCALGARQGSQIYDSPPFLYYPIPGSILYLPFASCFVFFFFLGGGGGVVLPCLGIELSL